MHAAAAHTKKGAEIRRRLEIPLSVAEEYVEADPGGKLPLRAANRRKEKR
jgi:hypothetical protein